MTSRWNEARPDSNEASAFPKHEDEDELLAYINENVTARKRGLKE